MIFLHRRSGQWGRGFRTRKCVLRFQQFACPKGDCFPVWAVVGGRLSLFRQCADLYGKITDSGALRNSALQRESSCLLRQPVQEPVPAAATDDKETFESFSAQGLDFPQAGCVSRRQAMKDEI